MKTGRRFLTGSLLVALAASPACASRQAAVGTANKNVVTLDELSATNSRYVYQALEKLRPSWLTSRGPANIGNVREATEAVANVYINGSRMGNVTYLRQVYVSDVHEVRYWTAGEASARFGMGNPRGVIEIIPRR